MSFQDLVGSGSACSTGNSAMKFVDQLNKNKFNGFQHPGPREDFNNMVVRPPPPNMADQQLVNEFFEKQKNDAMLDSFKFNEMNKELNNVIHAPPPPPSQLASSNWANEFSMNNTNFLPAPQLTHEEEKAFENAFNEAIKQHQELEWQNEFMRQENLAAGPVLQNDEIKEFEKIYEQHANQLNEDDWTEQFQEVERTLNSESKGKGKEEEYLNWKEEFEKNAYASLDQLEGDEKQEFDDAWEDAQAQTWEQEFEEYDSIDDLLTKDPDPITGPLEPYTFETINPYLDNPNAYEEGLKLLETGGSLSTAALAFEAVVQKDPKNSEAWLRLGNIQAENEKERPAIAALQRAVRENPENLEALMSLAISYTNEAMNLEAYSTLERWIKVQYPQVVKSNSGKSYISHEHIINLFLEAARLGPSKAAHKTPESETLAFDPDVQSGLGVLFFNDFDYDKAVDCFKAALSVRPNDYLLWNRLGATLANSGRCEEASNAYYQALEIKPTFVRCRYNLGIACMNIGCYKEAVEHFLGALSMHIIRYGKDGKGDDAGVNISDSIWETLRRTFVLMERHDLAELANPNTDLSVFENDFEF